MRYEIRLPSLGDDADAVSGGTISQWLAVPGTVLGAEDDLVELCTDKAAFIVPSPCAGTLLEWCVSEGDAVRTGDVLCVVEIRD